MTALLLRQVYPLKRHFANVCVKECKQTKCYHAKSIISDMDLDGGFGEDCTSTVLTGTTLNSEKVKCKNGLKIQVKTFQ